MDPDFNDPFFQVHRTTQLTGAGEVELPILYFDTSNLIALFRVDKERVASKLEGTGLVSGITLAGKAVVALSFYEYHRTTAGDYNEVGLAIPVLPKSARRPFSAWLTAYGSLEGRTLGYYILDLPVTTQLAKVAGREIWGYPKFVTDIPFQLDDRSFYGEVLDPDTQESIVTLSGRLGWGITWPPQSLVLYSQLGSRWLRATVDVRGPGKMRSGGGLRLHLGESQHRMARNLAELAMDGLKPFVVVDTHRFQSRLNTGVEVDLGVVATPASSAD
jgi:hypothetical protein